ncbi:MAG: hypothetical protein EHM64_08010, partial [Ignavibacteriae bacterium]
MQKKVELIEPVPHTKIIPSPPARKQYSNIQNRMYVVLLLVLGILFPYPSLKAEQNKPGTLDVYDLSLTHLPELEITSASKVAQKVSEVPSTVFIIPAAEIKENGYMTLEEALSDLPGFQFRYIEGFNSSVFQRGIPNQNNLTLLL